MKTANKIVLSILVMLYVNIVMNAQAFTANYTYDDNGNRITATVIYLQTSIKQVQVQSEQVTMDSIIMADSVNIPQQGWQKPTIEPLPGFEIKVYPNPTYGILMIEISGINDDALSNKDNVITIWDIQGRQINGSAKIKNINVVDLSQQVNGDYIVIMVINGQTKEYKIIKQ
jgi:hypothetical protein